MFILEILVGIVAVLWGADKFTDGASSIARRLNIPEIVIGLTIVAVGTSMPEFCVSLSAALQGTDAMAVSNIVGSNIFNALLIIGCATAAAPFLVSRVTIRQHIPIALGVSLLLVLFCLDGKLARWEAGVLFVGLLAFMWYMLREARKSSDVVAAKGRTYSMGWSIFFVVAGLGCLVAGSYLFVDGAKTVARMLGVSDAIIGLTIVAMGTSLPELATSVVAARKGQGGIAIGNVVGSNIINILLILGVTGLITPLSVRGLTAIDFGMLVVSMLLLWLMSYTKYKIERWEGILLAAIFLVYLGWLIYCAVCGLPSYFPSSFSF